jgi:hypothetical protein
MMRIMTRRLLPAALVALGLLAAAPPADAQILPRVTWNLAPATTAFLTLSVAADVDIMAVSGWLESEGTRSAAYGNAFRRPDGTVGMGLTVVFDSDGTFESLYGVVDPATLGGSWRSSRGGAGTLVLIGVTLPPPPPSPEPGPEPESEPEPEPEAH